jgi:hypothetical protein
MSNLGLGVHLRNTIVLGFQIVCQIFQNFCDIAIFEHALLVEIVLYMM